MVGTKYQAPPISLEALLGELQSSGGELPRKLDPVKADNYPIEKMHVNKYTFEKMHAENRMANEKLEEGIQGFTKALEQLEKLLADRLVHLEAA